MPEPSRAWHHVLRMGQGESRYWSTQIPAGSPAITVTLADPYVGVTHLTPLDRAFDDFPIEAAATDLVVLRGVSRAELETARVNAEELVERLEARAGSRPSLAILDWRDEGTILARLRCIGLVGDVPVGETLELGLRALEFQSQLAQTRAIYRPQDMHFQLPSGVHCNTYIRVADAMDDITSISRLADWIQHRLSPATVLLSDTWTTLPLLQDLAHRLDFARGTGAMDRDVTRASERILSFPQYPTLRQLRKTLDKIPPLLTSYAEPHVLFILSVVSSGDLLETFKALAAEHLPEVKLSMVALVNSGGGSAPVESYCDVSDVLRYDVARGHECALCRNENSRPVILIDPRRYFPLIEAEHRPVMLTHTFATRHRRFWELASSANAVRLHVDELSTGRRRHLAIGIQVERLIEDPDFASSLRGRLRTFAPDTDLVLIPQHPAADALGRLTREAFPSARAVIVRRSAETGTHSQVVEPDTRDLLRPHLLLARHILILDDVMIHGRTLKALHRLVQDLAHEIALDQSRSLDYSIKAFVVVARPERLTRWVHVRDSLRQSDNRDYLDCHELILLPEFCTWCQEAALLEEIVRRARKSSATNPVPKLLEIGREAIERRLHHLRSANTTEQHGLTDSIFFCQRDGQIRREQPDSISPHSLFGEGLSETAAYAAVSSAMQAMRCERVPAEMQGVSWYWDVIRIVSAYHDPILQASFLREARQDELRVPNTRELIRAVDDTFFDFERPGLRQSALLIGEHALTAAMEKYSETAIDEILRSCSRASELIGGDLSPAIENLRVFARPMRA